MFLKRYKEDIYSLLVSWGLYVDDNLFRSYFIIKTFNEYCESYTCHNYVNVLA